MTGRRYSGGRSSYRAERSGGRRVEQRGKQTSRRERYRMAQMLISAVLLLAVVGVKLLAPNLMNSCRDRLLGWMGREVDFVETFSALGEAIGGGALPDALGEAYQQVFGPSEEIPNETAQTADEEALSSEVSDEAGQAVYTAENLPEEVCLTQQVLGFAYAKPLTGEISSRFGYREHPVSGGEKFHYGVDIAADEGTVIAAFADGTVTAVGKSSELGNYVMLDHGDELTTLYAHCSKVTASSGQTVRCGDPIAEVGQTGQATGPHLHFEVHRNTTYLNPIYYVAA